MLAVRIEDSGVGPTFRPREFQASQDGGPFAPVRRVRQDLEMIVLHSRRPSYFFTSVRRTIEHANHGAPNIKNRAHSGFQQRPRVVAGNNDPAKRIGRHAWIFVTLLLRSPRATRLADPTSAPVNFIKAELRAGRESAGTRCAPGRIRTCDQRIRNPLLYPLSYGRKAKGDQRCVCRVSDKVNCQSTAGRCELRRRHRVRRHLRPDRRH